MRNFLLCVGLLCAGLPAASAQEPSRPDDLQRRIDALERELDALKREVRGPAGDPARPATGEAPGRGGAAASEPAPTGPSPEEAALPSDEQTQETPWLEEVKVGLFFIESEDEAFRLELRARLMIDARFTDRGVDDFQNHAEVRRGRAELVGHAFGKDRLTFRLGFEFGRTSDADLRDAYVDLRVVDALHVRAGQMLHPFSTERLTSSIWMMHPERPIIIGSIVGQRDLGGMVHGKLLDGLLRYYVGGFNGAGENARGNLDDDFDLAARLEVTPWKEHLLLAGSYIYTPTDRSSTNHGPADVRTVGNEVTRFLDYSGTNRHLGNRERAAAEARLRVAALELKGEAVLDHHSEVRSATGVEADLLTLSWFVDAAWVLLGQRKGDKVEPDAALFDPESGALGPGAFDVALRYEDYDADRRVLTDGFATGTDRVRAVTGTLHWYPWTKTHFALSYTASMFDDAVRDARGREGHSDHTVIVRWTFYF